MSVNNNIDNVGYHTIKKFELVKTYVESWAQKLMLNPSCQKLVFIDCMCNNGIYIDKATQELVDGSPVRAARVLADVAKTYTDKTVEIYLNDIKESRVEEIKKHLPNEDFNFHIITGVGDAGKFLKNIGPQLYDKKYLHYFLLYDPYDASIDWDALFPFFRNWGEILINHMVSDPVRAITQIRSKAAKEKYENTYLVEYENLIPYGSDKQAYEKRIREIIGMLKGPRKYFVAAFPFYNRHNSHLYSLIHCTSNEEGFKLYKKSAWKVFGGQSSIKHVKNDSSQLIMDFDSDSVGNVSTQTDESCFTVSDIAKYLNQEFAGQKDVPLNKMWSLLDLHPVFPSDGFRQEIKKKLKNIYGAQQRSEDNPETGKKEYFFTFLK